MTAAPPPAIRILPPELIARIAAGEVVERPASVLKELVENSLDAGATRIRVEIDGGGIQRLTVTDDGSGLSAAELSLAVQPHATSKLDHESRLHALTTLGFRGEALPSIASVSHFSMLSRRRPPHSKGDSDELPSSIAPARGPLDSDAAWRIEIHGGKPDVPEARPAAGPFGTTVEARDLFFNLPARRKFLKGISSEAAACADTLQRLALTRPDVAFTLYQGRNALLELPAVSKATAPSNGFSSDALAAPVLSASAYFQRARDVLGRTNANGLVEVNLQEDLSESPDHETSPCRLYGLISPPSFTRPNRNLIYLSVNGRAVKDRTLTSALLESCRHLLEPRRYPIAVLFLELPGEDVDINVHPSKAEVRFRQPGRLYALLHKAVRDAFGVERKVAGAGFSAVQTVDREMGREGERENWRTNGIAPVAGLTFPTTGALLQPLDEAPSAAELQALNNDVDLWPRSSQQLSEPYSYTDRVQEAPAPFGNLQHLIQPTPVSQPVAVSTPSFDFRIIGQAAASYIVLEDETGLRVIDQHALHERILFERLLASALKHARADSQGLLVPEPVELSAAQAALVGADSTAVEMLSDMGFECEPFGPRTLLIRAIPAIIKHSSPAKLVSEYLEALAGGSDDNPSSATSAKSLRRFSLREKAAYILSCKAALKAGERLTHAQMEALILEFRTVAGPLAERGNLTCPHGRKLSLDVSWHDLERAVGRA